MVNFAIKIDYVKRNSWISENFNIKKQKKERKKVMWGGGKNEDSRKLKWKQIIMLKGGGGSYKYFLTNSEFFNK